MCKKLISKNKIQLYLIIFSTVFLSGCVGFGGEYKETVEEKSGETKYFDRGSPIEENFDISYEVTNDGALAFNIQQNLLLLEYEADLIDVHVKHGTKANPVGSILMNTFLIGLPLLINTSEQVDMFTGYEASDNVIRTIRKNARKTGDRKWHKFSVDSTKVNIESDGVIVFNGLKQKANDIGFVFRDARRNSKVYGDTGKISSVIVKVKGDISDITKKIDIQEIDTYPVESVLWSSNTYEFLGKSESNHVNFNTRISNMAKLEFEKYSKLPVDLVREYNDLKNQPPKQITLMKGEFEKTSDFNKRVVKNKRIYDNSVQNYNNKISNINARLKQFDKTHSTLPQFLKLSVYEKALNSVRGWPILTFKRYDADAELFYATLTSSKGNYKQDVVAKVDPPSAKKLKDFLISISKDYPKDVVSTHTTKPKLDNTFWANKYYAKANKYYKNKEYKKSIKWYEKAIDKGHYKAKYRITEARKNINSLGRKITFGNCDRLSKINNKSNTQITLFNKCKKSWPFKWVTKAPTNIEKAFNNHRKKLRRTEKVIGDYAKGRIMYNNLGCSGCHGVGGKSAIPSYPTLAGKDAGWIVQQLKDFQSGARRDATMNAMAPMAAGHEKNIAQYLRMQK